MYIDLKKIAGLGAVLAALAAGPALAQGMSDWDSDGDGMISQDEFVQGRSMAQGEEGGTFIKWDEDADGMLTEEEFNAGMFKKFDRDQSGTIDEPEFGKVEDDLYDFSDQL